MPVYHLLTDERRKLAFRQNEAEPDPNSWQSQNLVGWWPLTDRGVDVMGAVGAGDQSTIVDRSVVGAGQGKGRYGCWSSYAPTHVPNWECPNAMRFEKGISHTTDSYFDCGLKDYNLGDGSIGLGRSFAVSAWFYRSAATGLQMFLGRGAKFGSGGSNGFGLYFASSNLGGFMNSVGSGFFGFTGTSVPVPTGEWVHCVASWEHFYNDVYTSWIWEPTLYANGVQDATPGDFTALDLSAAPTEEFRIGRASENVSPTFRSMEGWMADVRIYMGRHICAAESQDQYHHPYRMVRPRTFPTYSYGSGTPFNQLREGMAV